MIKTELSPVPHLVVFGRDTANKPHASWFDQASAELATKAAGLMNMRAVPIESDALRELAVTLPKGRVFSSGRAFTPFVAGKLYGQLEELTRDPGDTGDTVEPSAAAPTAPVEAVEPVEATPAKPRPALQVVAGSVEDAPGTGTPAPAAPLAAPGAKPPLRPSRLEDVGIGSLVLATTGPAEGWWEAEVIGTNGNMLTLRWRDFHEPTVVRRRTELGFLPALGG